MRPRRVVASLVPSYCHLSELVLADYCVYVHGRSGSTIFWGEGLSRQNIKTQFTHKLPTILHQPWPPPPPSYGSLPTDLLPRYYTQRLLLTNSFRIYHWGIFPTLGSRQVVVNRWKWNLLMCACQRSSTQQYAGSRGEGWQYLRRKLQPEPVDIVYTTNAVIERPPSSDFQVGGLLF
jgi:hypothetical protein